MNEFRKSQIRRAKTKAIKAAEKAHRNFKGRVGYKSQLDFEAERNIHSNDVFVDTMDRLVGPGWDLEE